MLVGFVAGNPAKNLVFEKETPMSKFLFSP
jgi:hypothetical protein